MTKLESFDRKLVNPMEQEIKPNWARPNLEKERGEIERVIKEFLLEESTEENIRRVINALEASPLVDLSDSEWESLENTDSFHNIEPGHIEEAERITDEYNEELLPENKRDFQNILNSIMRGGNMEAPTILKNKDGKLHLISGNTRLMIARALRIRPKVIIGQIT